MNTQHIWKMLINMPPFETYIHMEHCVEKFEQGRCAAGCRCTQRYTVRTMPVYERDANDCDLIYMDKFLFPSHCDCMCLPTPYVLFNITRPPATSPTPDVPPSSTFAPPRTDGASVTPVPGMSSDGEANSTVPETITDVDRIEALKASLSGARVVTAAPTSPPSSRRAPGLRHPPTVPSRRPIVPAEALVTTHRNRNRGPPPFGPPYPPLRRYSSRPYSPGSAPRRDGRADQMPPALPR
ncbi:proline-rich receptor-like protein kinase PERK9 [Pollicipes pollicipes]|uniref:proline-rich receptor-like protein kinase PERK9 n=1 Tax=Pollicipes pollicipes TaxID=41117 RepID=UPI001884DFB0|nr:proline-rich receptor-like protein kinase PERK9 [Pollicipes pollicipes]